MVMYENMDRLWENLYYRNCYFVFAKEKKITKNKMYQISFHYEFISLINEENVFEVLLNYLILNADS